MLGLSLLFQGAQGRKFLRFQACRIIAEFRGAHAHVRKSLVPFIMKFID